ncbi:MAG: 3-oxoacyl-[acyl-carrier-protein] synthase III C-terminal domain-containing protein [Acidobacteriota bacterium]
MAETRAQFLGSGVATGSHVIDNHRLARVMDTDDQWVRERSGIVTRRYVDKGVASSDLGADAARAALENAGVGADEVDYIVCATMTPDHYFPGSGTLLQTKLGMDTVPSLDLRQQCAGFAYGLQTVDALIRSGIARTVLLVGCDVHTCLMPFSDRTWELIHSDTDERLDDEEERAWNSRFRHLLVLFGDAAGAMVFRANDSGDGRGIVGHELHGDGANVDILYLPGLGSANRPIVTPDLYGTGEWVPVMEGRSVFKLAVTRMPKVTHSVLETHGHSLDDLDLLVMHQANLRINEAAQKALGLPDERVHNNIQEYGNTTSATLPLCFHEAREQGKAPDGSLVAFTALGAGMHWGSVLLQL